MNWTPTLGPPRDLIEPLFQSDQRTGGRPELPASARERALAWLRRVLTDFDALEAHAALLSALYDAPFRPVPPALPGSLSLDRPEPGTATRFRHTDRLGDDRVEAVADQGAEALGDRELAALLLNPYALHDLFHVLHELVPEAWQEAWHEAGGGTNWSPGSALPPTPPIEGGGSGLAGQLRWGAEFLAMAASVLVGIVIGSRAFPSKDGSPGRTDWAVTATLDQAGTRGIEAIYRIVIRSDLDGFATVVALSTEGSPEVTPGVGGDLIRARRGERVETLLPKDVPAPSVVLVVVAETPADTAIRRALRNRKYAPGEVDQLRSYLEARLKELNYRSLAFTVVKAPNPAD
jgi:hypothetical protein